MVKYIILIVALIGFTPLSAGEPNTGIKLDVEQPWARKTRRTMSAAAYMALANTSETAITITDVSSPIAEMVSLHRSYEDNGIMKMAHMPETTLEAGETLILAPGGYHIMLMQLAHPLEEGSSFPLTLHYETGAEQTVTVSVTGMSGLKVDMITH